MRVTKIISCIMLIFFAATMSGCKGFGKAVVRGTTRLAVNAVTDSATNDNQPTDNRTPNQSPARTSKPNLRTGAIVAGGAVVANEIVSEDTANANALNAKDLSLGDLTIDDPAEKVQAVLGSPYNVKTDGEGYTRLTYRDVEVVVYNGKIQALVSQSPVFATPRGIREGSSFSEVVDKYGTNYVESPYTVDTLYEYEITSADGNPCYLRFAVMNIDGKVKYISERFVQ